MNTNLSSILFDLDGTLLDTVPDLAGALNTLRSRYQLTPLEIDQVRHVTSYGSPGFIKLGFDIDIDHPQYPELKKEFYSLYENRISTETRPFNGVKTVLEKLKEQNLPWGIVTNKVEHLAKKVLKELGLLDHCTVVIGGDTTPFSKPSPEPLYAACSIINCDPQSCLFVGDSILDIEAAKRANMRSVVALYGYIPENEDPASWSANYSIARPEELLEIIKSVAQISL